MKTTRSLLLGLMLATVIPALQGCGNKNAFTTFTMPEGGYDNSAVEITFYSTMGKDLADVLDEYIAEFNVEYPNITITHNSIGSFDDVRDQMSTELSRGTKKQASMVYCYPDHVALYNKANAVAPLDELINDDKYGLGLTAEQKEDFIQAYYNEGNQFGDGKMYCLPFSKSTEVLYYNKTFFQEHGFEVPTTWDEMEALCRAIKKIDPKCIPLGYDSDSNFFITLSEQMNAGYTQMEEPHFIFDNAKNKEMVTKIKGWYDEGLMTTKGIYGQYTSSLFVETKPNELRSYMSIGSSAGATNQRPEKVNGEYPFEVGIAEIPQYDRENHPAVISQGPSICIFNSNNPQEVIASWLFTRFLLTSVAFQGEFSIASGYTPVIKSVFEDPTYKTFLDQADGGDFISTLSAKQCVDQQDLYFTSPAFVGSAEARDQVGSLLDAVLSNSKSIDQAFRDAMEACEETQ